MEDERSLLQKLRAYPPSVFFMLGNEFCERFSFYGMKTILFIYLITEHEFAPSTATFIYHAFACIAYFTPLIGSILADSVFGRFKVILYGSVIYVIGHVLLSIGAVPFLSYGVRSSMDFSGLFVIAFATGCIKPCVSAFAADQFEEHQKDLRSQFFSFFYFAINAGSLFAILITPILRGRVQCFGNAHCFPLAFGVPGVLMALALVLFLMGWGMYKKYPPSKENVIAKVVEVIYTSLRKIVRGSDKPVNHWLDHAAPEHSQKMIDSVRALLNVAVIFCPLIFFWALFDQQGSTWVLQARRLDGRVGHFSILPEQIHAINPICVLILVPVFEAWVYPALRKITRVTPLRKMAVGGLLTAFSFSIAGGLQLIVNETMEFPPALGHVYVQRIGNETLIHDFNGTADKSLSIGRNEMLAGVYQFSTGLGNEKKSVNFSTPNKGYVMAAFRLEKETRVVSFDYKIEKTDNGATRVFVVSPYDTPNHKVYAINSNDDILSECPLISGSHVDIIPGIVSDPHVKIYWGPQCNETHFKLCANSMSHINVNAQMGAVHVLHIHQSTTENDLDLLVRPNSVSILWSLPQYIIITLGEVLLSVTGLEFAYSQAAPNMKSVLTAMWLLTVFAGNLVAMLISGTRLIPNPALEFFFYSILMCIVMGVFILLAMQYTYVEEQEDDEDDDSIRIDEKKNIEMSERISENNNA